MSDEQQTLAAWLDLFERLTSNPITHPITQPIPLPIEYRGQQFHAVGHYLTLRDSEATELAKLSVDVATIAARRGRADLAEPLFLMGSEFRVGGDGVAVFPDVEVGVPKKVWAAIKALAAANVCDLDGEVPKAVGVKISVNARMLDTMSKNPESRGWSIRQWAEHLRCVISTVQKTPAWKSLQVMNAGDRLGKGKPKDRSRHGGGTIHRQK